MKRDNVISTQRSYSWGINWGSHGYFTMPYEYLLQENLADDFWTIRLVETNPSAKRKK
jgi:hypothetical protein